LPVYHPHSTLIWQPVIHGNPEFDGMESGIWKFLGVWHLEIGLHQWAHYGIAHRTAPHPTTTEFLQINHKKILILWGILIFHRNLEAIFIKRPINTIYFLGQMNTKAHSL
ncbi:hypothetical protein ACJX0J_041753, partial [Zea mays]